MTRTSTRLLRAGLLTGLSDGLFACVLFTGFYGASLAQLWQGVAATVLGRDAVGGGLGPAVVGVAIHFGVAFGWSAVFLALFGASPRLRALTSSTRGIVLVAAVYGPLIWAAMSLIIIPLVVGRPPVINPVRWCIQGVGHFPFVGLPIVAGVAGRPAARPAR